MNAGTASTDAQPQHLHLDPDELREVRRKAKRVQTKAGALAREVAQLEDLCRQYGIGVVVNDE